MTYIINNTDGTQFAVIADGTINSQSSMTLVGKNYAGYGQFLDENFLHLLQNSSNSVPPPQPITGQLWWNTTINQLQIYDGSIFKTISAASASVTPPTAPSVGDLWFDTQNQQLNVWTGTAWLLVGPTSSPDQGKTGAFPLTIQSNTLANITVIGLYDTNTLTATVSKEVEFSPQAAIPGFPTIKPGIQLAIGGSANIDTAIQFTGNFFSGTANNALNLGGIPADQYLTTGGGGGGSGNISLPGNVSVLTSLGVGGANLASGTPGTIVTQGSITVNNPGTFIGNGSTLNNINGANVSGIVPNATNAVNATNATTAATATSANGTNPNNNFQMLSLGVGTGPSGTAGEIRATNNITAYFSDDRLKTRLGNIEGALDKVKQLTGFYYEANETAQALGYQAKREVGLSAQDVNKVLPEVVAPAPIDPQYMTLHYERIGALLVEAIKELADEVEAIKKKIG
jgi:hypothetical protein